MKSKHVLGSERERIVMYALKAAIRRWNPTGNYPTIVIDDRESRAWNDEEKIRARLG
jgi:hypothetical protein